MVKNLLCVLLLVPCVQVMAQSVKKADGITVYSISPNGKYACASNEGVAVLWNTEKDNDVSTFDGEWYYCNGVSDDGLMAGSVGQTGSEKPVLFSVDRWIDLPMPTDNGEVWAYGGAYGISSDNKMVCGILTRGDVDMMGNTTYSLPYVWELDGDKIECTALPYPEKDYTGRCPQGYHPIFVSTDKNRILGRQIDYTGFAGAIAVWERTAPGESWSCTLLGEDVQYVDGPAFPEWPEEPQEVDYEEFMTAEEIAAYDAAYQEWKNNNYAGIAPEREDFITDQSKKRQYLDAVAEYDEAMAEYKTKYNEFQTVYSQRLSGYSLDLYGISASFNGRYVGCKLSKPDPDAMLFETLSYPCYFDLGDNNKFVKWEDEQHENMALSGRITDAGDLLVAKPAQAGLYDVCDTYVIPAGQKEAVAMYKFLDSKTGGKVNRQTFADGGLEYSWTDYITGEPVEVTDSILCGKALMSADGLSAVGFFADPSTFSLLSWSLNGYTAGVEDAVINVGSVLRTNVISSNGMIEFVENVERAVLSDAGGRVLFNGTPRNGCIEAPAGRGIYVLRSQLDNGEVRTDKVVVR